MQQTGRIGVITPFFNLVLAFNAGAAFSFLGDASGWQRYLFSAFALGAAALTIGGDNTSGGEAPACTAPR